MVNWRKLALQNMLISWGQIPHPRASLVDLEIAIRTTLVKISKGTELDPEVPNDLLSCLLPALRVRGVEPEELAKAAMSLTELSSPGAGKPSGTIATTVSSVENETILENLGDIGSGILSLDIGETVGGIADLFGDFFSGGGIW